MTYNFHSSCKHMHFNCPLKVYAIKNVTELYVIGLPGVILPKALVLQDECFGKNYSSFLDFTRNYERTSGVFVPWVKYFLKGKDSYLSLLYQPPEGVNICSCSLIWLAVALLGMYLWFDCQLLFSNLIICLFLLLYVPCQQLWSLRDGQFT